MAAPKKARRIYFMFEILEYGEHIGVIAETYQEALEYIHLRVGRLDIAEGVQYNEETNSWETIELPKYVSRVNYERFEIIPVNTVKEEIENLKTPRAIVRQIEIFIKLIEELDKSGYTADTLKTIDKILNMAKIALVKCSLDESIDRWRHCNEIYINLIYEVRSLTGNNEVED